MRLEFFNNKIKLLCTSDEKILLNYYICMFNHNCHERHERLYYTFMLQYAKDNKNNYKCYIL
jgi:hypothetical protein